jgi:hypothetical protein
VNEQPKILKTDDLESLSLVQRIKKFFSKKVEPEPRTLCDIIHDKKYLNKMRHITYLEEKIAELNEELERWKR